MIALQTTLRSSCWRRMIFITQCHIQ